MGDTFEDVISGPFPTFVPFFDSEKLSSESFMELGLKGLNEDN